MKKQSWILPTFIILLILSLIFIFNNLFIKNAFIRRISDIFYIILSVIIISRKIILLYKCKKEEDKSSR